MTPLFNSQEVLSSASGKAKLFAKNFSRDYNLGTLTQVLLCLFSVLELI